MTIKDRQDAIKTTSKYMSLYCILLGKNEIPDEANDYFPDTDKCAFCASYKDNCSVCVNNYQGSTCFANPEILRIVEGYMTGEASHLSMAVHERAVSIIKKYGILD